MKKISLLFLIPLFLTTPAFAQEFKSQEDAEKKLATYTVSDIDGDSKRLADKQELKIDQMFNDLEATAKLLEKEIPSEGLVLQMERVSLITFINDPSTFAVELILPIYQKNKTLFEKAAQKLHSYDRNMILQILKSKDQAETEGNG